MPGSAGSRRRASVTESVAQARPARVLRLQVLLPIGAAEGGVGERELRVAGDGQTQAVDRARHVAGDLRMLEQGLRASIGARARRGCSWGGGPAARGRRGSGSRRGRRSRLRRGGAGARRGRRPTLRSRRPRPRSRRAARGWPSRACAGRGAGCCRSRRSPRPARGRDVAPGRGGCRPPRGPTRDTTVSEGMPARWAMSVSAMPMPR